MSVSEQCRLLSGEYALFIQALLATVCVVTLILKRQNEVPRRDALTFSLDLSKQGTGSMLGHFSNILLATVLAARETKSIATECSWYLASYLTDCSLGLALNLLLLHLLDRNVRQYTKGSVGLQFGFYGSPPSLRNLWPQLLAWISIICVSKLIILAFLILVFEYLDLLLSSTIEAVFVGYPKLELFSVMIGIPCVVNVAQFWVTDTFIKDNNRDATSTSLLRRDAGGGVLAQPFLAVKTYDDCDENYSSKLLGTSVRRVWFGDKATAPAPAPRGGVVQLASLEEQKAES